MSAPKAAASLRALRRRSRLPAMSPTIAGICPSAMTRWLLTGSGMSETFARGLREAQCGTFSWQASQERVVDEGDAEYYFTLLIIGITEAELATNVTVKGQVTLPKAVREA